MSRKLLALAAVAVALGASLVPLIGVGAANADVELVGVGDYGGPDARPGWQTMYLSVDDGMDAYVELRDGDGGLVEVCAPGEAIEPYEVVTRETQSRACSFSSLPAGTYTMLGAEIAGGEVQWPGPPVSHTFTVRPAPQISTLDNLNGTVTIMATEPSTGTAGLTVYSPGGARLCDTSLQQGPWSCDVSGDQLGWSGLENAYAFFDYPGSTMPSAFTEFDLDTPVPPAPQLTVSPPDFAEGRQPGWARVQTQGAGGATLDVRITGPESPACELTGSPVASCTVSGLDAGSYTVTATQTLGGQRSAEETGRFRVYEAPTGVTATLQGPASVLFEASPQGDANRIRFIDIGTGAVVCDGEQDGATWRCTADGWAPGAYEVAAYAWNNGSGDFGSALSAVVTFRIEPPAEPQAPRVDVSFVPAGAHATARITDGEAFALALYLDVAGELARHDRLSLATAAVLDPCERENASRVSCEWTDLAPGDYVAYATRTAGESGYSSENVEFTVPQTPTVADAADAENGFVATGRGSDGQTVIVSAGNRELCRDVVSGGSWSCESPTASGASKVVAVQQHASGGLSALSAPMQVRQIEEPVEPPVTPPLPPLEPPGPIAWSFTVTGLQPGATVRPGDVVKLFGEGLPAGASVRAELHSRPIVLGTTKVDANGVLDMTVVVPRNVEPGTHELYVVLTPAFGAASPATHPVRVVPLAEEPGPEPEPEPEPGPGEAPVPVVTSTSESGDAVNPGDPLVPGAGTDRDEAANPTILTNGIATAQYLVENPSTFGFAALLALAVLLFVSIPSAMLDSALKSNLGAMGRFSQSVEARALKLVQWVERKSGSRLTMPVLLVLLGAIVFGLADPDFGFDVTTARTELSLLAATLLLAVGVPAITDRIARRRWGIDTWYQSEPLGLLAALAGVALTRFVEFSPGIFIGILFGLEVAKSSETVRDKARLVALQAGITLGVAVFAWLFYSFLLTEPIPSDFGSGFLHDFMVSLTLQGMTSMVISLLPLAFLDGQKLISHSRSLWLGLYAVSALGFGVLVMPQLILSQTPVSDALTWLIALVAYAAFAITVWAIFRRWRRRRPRAIAEAQPETVAN